MKSKFAAVLCLLAFGVTVMAQKPESTNALKDMVETEQSFAKTAAVKTTREAFMEFIADDGLLFRPGAVNGKKWMSEHPVPPSDKHPLLAWQPAFAGMSMAGDLGFTTGPWEFKEDVNDAKPAGYGHFVTLWKKQTDGSWKFVVDLGISHPQPGGPLVIWRVPIKKNNKSTKLVSVAKDPEQLLERDRSYAAAVLKEGLSKTFVTYAAPNARLYLPEKLPFVGRVVSVEALAPVKGVVIYKASAGDVSRSGDLGYTHGIYEKRSADDPAKVVEGGSYVRIWSLLDGRWQVVLDVTNPAR